MNSETKQWMHLLLKTKTDKVTAKRIALYLWNNRARPAGLHYQIPIDSTNKII